MDAKYRTGSEVSIKSVSPAYEPLERLLGEVPDHQDGRNLSGDLLRPISPLIDALRDECHALHLLWAESLRP